MSHTAQMVAESGGGAMSMADMSENARMGCLLSPSLDGVPGEEDSPLKDSAMTHYA
jgi:hypothetical protein